MSKRRRIAFAVCCGVASTGCDSSERKAGTAVPAQPSAVVDSVLPVAEALERFQHGLPRVSKLEDAAGSRDDLVRHFMAALERADSAELARLHVSRAEYAFLYYPTSVYTRKPYELSPDIAWLLSDQNSRKGRDRIMRRLAGRRLELHGYECGVAATEGRNRFWRSCHVSFTDLTTAEKATRKLFGPIIERDGGYKLLSYSNDF